MEDRVETFYSDVGLRSIVKQLNAFTSSAFPWREVCANKDHTDLFGLQVKTGESYYKVQSGVAYDDVIKLSKLSMARLVYALFTPSNSLSELAERILKQREESQPAPLEIEMNTQPAGRG